MLHVRNRSEEAPYLDVEIVSPAKVKRESIATNQLALRRSVSWQASDRDKSLLVGNRLDFRIAEGSALASLRRMMAEIMSRLDSMAVQTRSQVVRQGQAQWEGAAVVEMANISTRSPHSAPGPTTRNPSTPATTSPTATDYRVPKRAASHEHFDPIEPDGQPNDKRSGEPSAAPSDTTKFQSRPLADMAHRDGGTNTGPNSLKRQRWKSDNRARDDLYASSARYPAHEHGTIYGPDTPSPSQRPSVHHAATKTSRVFTTSPPHMPKIPHPPERNRLRAPASRCDNFSGVARKVHGDSFVRRQFQVDMRGQRCKPGRERRCWSRTIRPRHLTWTRDARQNMELDRRVNARPRFQEDKLRRLDSAPAAHTRRPEVSSSLTHSAPASARTDGLVAVGLGVKSVDSLECPATSKNDQAADINDVEALERLHSEISEHGQILEQALLEDDTISMIEVEVAEPKKKDTHDAPLESQQQRDEDRGQRRVPTRSASREIRELPDTETLLSKLEDSQNNQKVRSVFSTADAQKGGLRGTRSVETVKQSLANVPNSEIKDPSAVPQSSTPKNTTFSIAEPPKVSAFSRVVEKAEVSSKFRDSKIGVNGTPQSTIVPGHGQRPSDQHDIRRRPTTSNPKLRAFPRDGCQEDCMLTKQALSYPNTIEVHPPSNATGQRRFARPIPSKAREIEMRPSGVSPRHCKCSFLPDYFRKPVSPIPNLKTWPAGRWEFFAHCQQIVECSAHPEITRTTCREILDTERRHGEVQDPDPLPRAHTEQRIGQE